MITIQLLEHKDLEKLNSLTSYFFMGDKGFFEKNNLPRYVYKDAKPDQLIGIANAISSSKKEELDNLKKHMCESLDYHRKKLKEYQENVQNTINKIAEMKDTLNVISKSKDFKEAVYSVITS